MSSTTSPTLMLGRAVAEAGSAFVSDVEVMTISSPPPLTVWAGAPSVLSSA